MFASWPAEDRGAVLALREEQADTCEHCGHSKSECRDPASAGQWTVIPEICQASRVAQAVAEDSKARGLVLMTRRNR